MSTVCVYSIEITTKLRLGRIVYFIASLQWPTGIQLIAKLDDDILRANELSWWLTLFLLQLLSTIQVDNSVKKFCAFLSHELYQLSSFACSWKKQSYICIYILIFDRLSKVDICMSIGTSFWRYICRLTEIQFVRQVRSFYLSTKCTVLLEDH